MGCGNSTIRRVHPAGGDGETSPRSASSQRSPSPREAVPTVSTATQTPPLTTEEDENKGEISSDEGSHEPDNELADQPGGSERDNVEVEDKGKSGSATNGSNLKNGNEQMETAVVGEDKAQEDTSSKQDDQQEEDLEVKPVVRIHISKVDSIDIREEDGEDTTPGPREKADEKKDSDMTDGGEPAPVSSEEISVKDPSPIPIPDSKEIDKEVTAVVESKDLEHKEEEKPQPVTNQAEKGTDQAEKGPDQAEEASNSAAVDEGIEDPSSEKDVDVGDSTPSQHNPPDPLAKASHPLKPLPDFDDGITVTKSEPRLPLLPPIGSKKVHPLQTSKGVAALTSQSETILHTSESTTKDAKEGAKEKRRGGDGVPQSKKKSAGSLRSSSGSSISKSKKASSSSSSATSLRSKSKSKESLKSGSQGHNSAKSRNSDGLSNGASKKLTRSRESIKAASHVYSSTPPPKSAESVKKGDAGKSGHTSKTKEASKEGDSEENKHDSAEKEAAVPTSIAKEGAGEDGGTNKVEEMNKDKDAAVNEKQPEQSTEDKSVQEQQSSAAKESPNKSDVVDSQLADEKVKETKTQCNEDAKSLPSAPNDQNTKENAVESSPKDGKGQDAVEVADSKAKGEKSSSVQQENPNKPLTPDLLPNEKALPSIDDEDKISLTSPTDSNRKLEIDKKTGQSEQSIVEAVEKSREQVQ